MKIRETAASVIERIFGWGIAACLLAGGLSFPAYLVALILDGDSAVAICDFIYKRAYPVLVILSSSMILLGLVGMVLRGEKAFAYAAKGRARTGR